MSLCHQCAHLCLPPRVPVGLQVLWQGKQWDLCSGSEDASSISTLSRLDYALGSLSRLHKESGCHIYSTAGCGSCIERHATMSCGQGGSERGLVPWHWGSQTAGGKAWELGLSCLHAWSCSTAGARSAAPGPMAGAKLSHPAAQGTVGAFSPLPLPLQLPQTLTASLPAVPRWQQ